MNDCYSIENESPKTTTTRMRMKLKSIDNLDCDYYDDDYYYVDYVWLFEHQICNLKRKISDQLFLIYNQMAFLSAFSSSPSILFPKWPVQVRQRVSSSMFSSNVA